MVVSLITRVGVLLLRWVEEVCRINALRDFSRLHLPGVLPSLLDLRVGAIRRQIEEHDQRFEDRGT